MIVPALFGMAVVEINNLVQSILAAMLPEGSVTYIYYTNRLTELVHGVFILSIGNVILPEMSRMTAVDDLDKLKKLYSSAIGAVIFLALPAAAALMTIGFPVISVLFMRGEFTAVNAEMTYRSLFFASMGILFVAVLRITTPTFYSLKDTLRPVIAASVSFILNFTLGYILMNTELQHAGLSLAAAISSTIQMLILFIWLQKRIGRIDMSRIVITFLKVLLSAGVMALVINYIAGQVDWVGGAFLTRLVYLVLIVASGGAVYIIMTFALGVTEVRYFADKVAGRIRRK